jgi:hypothetical protein
MSILARRFFSSPRFRFDSRILLLSAGGRGDLRRRSFARNAICAARFCWARFAIASSKRSRANLRFCACDLESCTVTAIPLGRWRKVTAVATLFTFCPPGPPERANVSSRSTSRMPRRCIRSRSEFTPYHSAHPIAVKAATLTFILSLARERRAAKLPVRVGDNKLDRWLIKLVEYFRGHDAGRATSKSAHREIYSRAPRSSHRANFRAHRRVSPP